MCIIENVIVKQNSENVIIFGNLYALYVLYIAGFFLWAFMNLIKKHQKSQGVIKQQLEYIFIGSFLTATISCVTNLFMPTFGCFFLNWMGQASTIFYVVGTSTAVIKTRLMDISVIISKSIAYGTTIIILGIFYILFVISYRSNISQNIDIGFVSTSIAYGILVGFYFERLRMFIQTSSDKVFLKGRYDFTDTLTSISEALSSIVSLKDFYDFLEKIRLDYIEASSLKINMLGDQSQQTERSLIEFLGRSKKIFHVSELPKDAAGSIDKTKTELLVPCFVKGKLAAILIVGKKLSEDPYREEEIDVFKVLAPQIATVIERVKPYEKVKEEALTQQAKAKSAEEIAGKAMEVAEKMAQQASYATLTRGIAHEIRNPMAIMLSRAEITEKHLDDKEAVAQFADMIKRNILRLINITETMLKYGGAVSNERAKLSVAALLQDILLLAEGEFKKREITVTTDISNDLSIIGDPNRLNQAFLNVILNAMQAIGNKGTISISTKESTFKNRKGETVSGVEVRIQDSGCGIPKENLPNIFDPFFTTKHECTGLGLSLVARIIDEHGGMIEIDSEVGKGTAFRVYLPV